MPVGGLFSGAPKFKEANFPATGRFVTTSRGLNAQYDSSSSLERAFPYYLPFPVTIDGFGTYVSVAGDASSAMLLGIRDNTRTGTPGELLWSGIIEPANSTGYYYWDVPPIRRQVFWLCIATRYPTTQPKVEQGDPLPWSFLCGAIGKAAGHGPQAWTGTIPATGGLSRSPLHLTQQGTNVNVPILSLRFR